MSNKAQIEEMIDFWQKNLPNSQKTIENIKNKVFNEPEETMEYRFGQVLVSEIAEPLVQSLPNYKPNLAREKFADEKLCKFFEVLRDFNKNFSKFFKQNFGGFDRFVKNEIISKTPLEKRIPLSWCVQIDEIEKIFEDFGDTQVCPVCGKYIFKSYGEICPLCNWENEGLFYSSGGANDDDVFSARKKYNLKTKTSPAHLWQNFRKKIDDASKTDERIYEEKVVAFFEEKIPEIVDFTKNAFDLYGETESAGLYIVVGHNVIDYFDDIVSKHDQKAIKKFFEVWLEFTKTFATDHQKFERENIQNFTRVALFEEIQSFENSEEISNLLPKELKEDYDLCEN